VLSRNAQRHAIDVLPMLEIVLSVALVGIVVLVAARQSPRRAAEDLAGVRARLQDLAVTDTELLVGNDIAKARHYPLRGWEASVDDANGRTAYLTLHAPDGGEILRVLSTKKSGGFQARAFAQAVNIGARRQAGAD
jgi:hypothetical protein